MVTISTGAQIRAARALLGWTRQELAAAAGLHRNAVAYWERAVAIPPPLPSGRRTSLEPHACRLIREALEHAGVAIIAVPAAGVCLRAPASGRKRPCIP